MRASFYPEIFTLAPTIGVSVRIENSFIPVQGVGEHTERQLWQRGITDWNAFDPTVVGPTLGSRIETYIEEARDRLAEAEVSFFANSFPQRSYWRLYENFSEETCFVDIESTGLDFDHHVVTVVSLYQDGETTTLVRGDDLTSERLQRHLDAASVIASFNGARFDLPFLKRSFDISVDIPHIDLMYPCRRIGLQGGLKRIERELGIDRDGPDIGGREAIDLWHASERGDDDALEQLIRYNRDDTENLESLMEVVTGTLHDRVYGDIVPDEPSRSNEDIRAYLKE